MRAGAVSQLSAQAGVILPFVSSAGAQGRRRPCQRRARCGQGRQGPLRSRARWVRVHACVRAQPSATRGCTTRHARWLPPSQPASQPPTHPDVRAGLRRQLHEPCAYASRPKRCHGTFDRTLRRLLCPTDMISLSRAVVCCAGEWVRISRKEHKIVKCAPSPPTPNATARAAHPHTHVAHRVCRGDA